MANKCSYCGKIINGLPFKCKYCGKYYCFEHHLPEDHKCHNFLEYQKGNKKRWEEIIKNEFEYKHPKTQRKIIYKKYKPSFSKKSKRKKTHPYSHQKSISHKHKSFINHKLKKHFFKKFIKNYWFPAILILLLLFVVAYANGYHSIFFNTCEDGTLYNKCSLEKPYFCFNGTLIKNSTSCGCSYEYEPQGNDCAKKPTCSDGSFYSECGVTRPFYCYEGILVEKASICGCPKENVKEGEKCISKYQTNPKTIKLNYLLNGKKESFNYKVYGGLNNYLSNLPDSISYYSVPPTTKDFIMRDLDNKLQKEFLLQLVNKIQESSSNTDEQARIAIKIVQEIPYDYGGLYGIPEGRLPYEVLYDMKGVCGEKSELLAFLLRELNFGVAIFEFDVEGHRAVGIKCPSCDYKSSGYCFIESTTSTIPTDSEGEYFGAGKLGSPSEIIYITEGNSLDLSKECADAQEWNNLLSKGEYLSEYDYNRWLKLVKEYGIEIEESGGDELSNPSIEVPIAEFEYEYDDYEIDLPPLELGLDEPYCPPLTKSELLNCHSISRDSRCPKSKTELLCK